MEMKTYNDLRVLAEEELKTHKFPFPHPNETNLPALLHEFDVHQIELETQNENLRRSQLELQRSRDDYQELYDCAPFGYLTLDLNKKIVNCNSAASLMFGLPNKKEIRGQPFTKFVSPESQDILYLGIQNLKNNEKKQGMEIKLKKSSRYIFFEAALKPYPENGTALIFATFVDITELKTAHNKIAELNEILEHKVEKRTMKLQKTLRSLRKSKEMLRHSEKMEVIGQLAAGVAHDFNNQLSCLSGCNQLLRNRVSNNPGVTKFLDMMQQSIDRSSELTTRLLAFARKGKYHFQEILINKLIEETTTIYACSLEKKININARLSAENLTIMGDPPQIQNAILNLTLNARDAMPDGGDLFLSTTIFHNKARSQTEGPFTLNKGSYAQIKIKDSGIGMDENTKRRIFEPFFTTKKMGMGTGLGMAAVYGIVKAHQGYIDVKSAPGAGTTVTMFFPLVVSKNKAGNHEYETNKRIKTTATKNVRILLVDDEDMIRETAEDMLTGEGYHVVSRENGLEALELYKDSWKDIDIVILDMLMPEMDGFDTFYELLAVNPKAKVILISGYSIDNKIRELLENGAYAFIEKPFNFNVMIDKIEKAFHVK